MAKEEKDWIRIKDKLNKEIYNRPLRDMEVIESIQSKVVSILDEYREDKVLFKEALEWIIEQL